MYRKKDYNAIVTDDRLHLCLISQEVKTMGARREAALALALISVVSALTMEGMKKVGDKIVERQKKEQENFPKVNQKK